MTGTLKAAIFYDVRDWAFHNVAEQVARHTEGFDVTTYGRSDWFGKADRVEDIALNADVLVFLWRFDLLAFLDCLSARAWRRFTGPDRPALVTMVYDHLYVSQADLSDMGDPFAVSDAVGCCSQRLTAVYDAAPHLPRISATIPDGVDLSLFTPGPPRDTPQGPLRVGWVGNSAWGSTVGHDFKGFRTVFGPALAQLKARGIPVDIKVADAAVRRRPRSEMPQFYHDIDVLVCTSAIEGTPNPVLEAMACGAAIVSTDVGIVPEILGPLQSGFILSQRSPEALSTNLEKLHSDRDLCRALQQENLGRRDQHGWARRGPSWTALMTGAIAAREGETGEACSAELLRYRRQTRSGVSRARRLVATNRAAFMAYEALRRYCPGAIRHTKNWLSRGTA